MSRMSCTPAGLSTGIIARDEFLLGAVRQRRRAAGVVVAGQRQHAAVLRGAGGVAVLEHVAAAVDARALAVPHGEHAVVLRAGEQVGLLRAPDHGRAEVLVEARRELDAMRLEVLLGLPQLQVEAAQRRAAVAGDEAGGVRARPRGRASAASAAGAPAPARRTGRCGLRCACTCRRGCTADRRSGRGRRPWRGLGVAGGGGWNDVATLGCGAGSGRRQRRPLSAFHVMATRRGSRP